MKRIKEKKAKHFRSALENAKSRKKGASYGYLKIPQGVDVCNPEPNTTLKMDIMPYEITNKKHSDISNPEQGELWYKRPFKIHRDIGINNDKVVCPTSFGKKCPICDYRNKLINEGGDKKEIEALKTSNRNLYAIILKTGKKSDSKKVHLLDLSDHTFQKVFEEQLADLYPDQFEVFYHNDSGYTLSVVFGEDSYMGHKFAKPTRFDFVERKVQYDDSILDEIPKLDECFEVLSYDDLKVKFFELEEDDDDYESEKASKKKPVKKKPIVKDEDEEEEEEEEEEDDEDDEDEDDEDEDDEYEDDEDEDDEEEEDDEDEDDEEEEPEPPKKVKRKQKDSNKRR